MLIFAFVTARSLQNWSKQTALDHEHCLGMAGEGVNLSEQRQHQALVKQMKMFAILNLVSEIISFIMHIAESQAED
jgi:hypothetical protein